MSKSAKIILNLAAQLVYYAYNVYDNRDKVVLNLESSIAYNMCSGCSGSSVSAVPIRLGKYTDPKHVHVLHNLQVCNCWGLGLGFGLWSGLDQKFADCACAISKMCSTFCKLCRLTNREQQSYMVGSGQVKFFWSADNLSPRQFLGCI